MSDKKTKVITVVRDTSAEQAIANAEKFANEARKIAVHESAHRLAAAIKAYNEALDMVQSTLTTYRDAVRLAYVAPASDLIDVAERIIDPPCPHCW